MRATPFMLQQPLVFLDLETTGVRAAHDRIIEIGLCEVQSGTLLGEWSTLVNPGRPIPPFIRQHTGIDDRMVADAPVFAELAAVLHERLVGKVLVAHNARFDYGFLQHEFARHGLEFTAPLLCTVRLSRRLFPGERRHGLDALIDRHGLGGEARHRALGDARVIREFLRRIVPTCSPAMVANALGEQLGALAVVG